MIGKKNLGRGAVDSRAILDGSIAAADLSTGALSGASADLDSAGLVRMADGTLTPGVTIYNNSGSTLTKGTLVYVSSYTGANGLVVVKADADAGLEATHVIPVDIANSASGIAVETVVLTGLNTNGQTIGDAVYVSATAGGFVFTAPSGADQMVQVVGTVKVVNATTGEIEFFPGAGRITKVCTSMMQDQAVNAAKLDSGMFITYGGLAKDGSNLREAVTIYNQTGGTLAVGTLLNISGFSGTDGLTVTKADADAGIVATHVVLTAINNLSSGFVCPVGLAQNVNTNGRTIGDAVYVDATTAGGFTFSAPTGADQMVQLVGVVKVVNATTGEIVFFPGSRQIQKLPTSLLQDGAVTLAKMSATAKPVQILVAAGIFTTAGGDANESITEAAVTGTDTAVVFVQKAGATPRTVDTITPGAGSIGVVLSGDPSNDHKLGYFVFRAAA